MQYMVNEKCVRQVFFFRSIKCRSLDVSVYLDTNDKRRFVAFRIVKFLSSFISPTIPFNGQQNVHYRFSGRHNIVIIFFSAVRKRTCNNNNLRIPAARQETSDAVVLEFIIFTTIRVAVVVVIVDRYNKIVSLDDETIFYKLRPGTLLGGGGSRARHDGISFIVIRFVTTARRRFRVEKIKRPAFPYTTIIYMIIT